MINTQIMDFVSSDGYDIKPSWNNCHKITIEKGKRYKVLAALDREDTQTFGIRMWFSYQPMGLKVNPVNVHLSYFSLSENATVIHLVENSAEQDDPIRTMFVEVGDVWVNIQNIEGRSNRYNIFVEGF